MVTTTYVRHNDEQGPSLEVTIEKVEIMGLIGEAGNHGTNVNMTNAPFQLLKAERDLLSSCIGDQSFRKRSGNIDWDKIENIFEDKADGCKVFRRDRKRLRSTSNKFKVHTNKVSTTSHNSEVQELLPIGDMMGVTKVAVTVVEERTTNGSERESIEEGKSEIEGDSITHEAVSVMEPKRRVGSLNDLEREFVKDYGKKCLMKGKNIDSNCMLKEYRTVFPGFTRDGDILKKCWINWKKDSPAYRDFVNSLKK
jgi:hypothetical protein